MRNFVAPALKPFAFRCPDMEGRLVVLVPIRVRTLEDGIGLSWACNKGEFCGCKNCVYARAKPGEPENFQAH